MGVLDPKQLFVDKFITYNEDRYKDDDNAKAAFQGLTIGECDFGAVTKEEKAGVYVRTFAHVNSLSRNFSSDPQHFNAANLASASVTTSDPLAGITEVRAAAPGVYTYNDPMNNNVRTLCLVYPHDMDTTDADAFLTQVHSMINGACKYALEKEDFTISAWPGAVATDKMTYVQGDIIAGWVLTIKGTQDTLHIPETDYGDLIVDPNTGGPGASTTGTTV